MKKLLMAAVALICVTMACTTMTACSSSENDVVGGVISYTPEGAVVGDGVEQLVALTAKANYTTAIEKVVGLFCTTSKDAEVIAACDKVYEGQRAQYSTWEGKIFIVKSNWDNTKDTIKTYVFER